MAHAAFHFGVGLAVGTALMAPSIARKLRSGEKMSELLGKSLVLAYGLGLLAVLPGILRVIGLPAFIRDGWWMNVCVFYPLINKLKQGGMLIGEFLITGCFILQYVVLLAALRKQLKARAELQKSDRRSS